MNLEKYVIHNGQLYSSDELYHYGVLGMKWGVRRYRNPDGSYTSAGQRRLAKKIDKRVKKDPNVYNLSKLPEIQDAYNKLYDAHKKRKDAEAVYHEYSDLPNSIRKKYEERAARQMCAKYRITDKATINKVIEEYHHHDYRFYDKGDSGDLSFKIYLKDKKIDPDTHYKTVSEARTNYYQACADVAKNLVGKYGDENLSTQRRTISDAIQTAFFDMRMHDIDPKP